eukprot:6454467-Prymnesium_polylepis.1
MSSSCVNQSRAEPLGSVVRLGVLLPTFGSETQSFRPLQNSSRLVPIYQALLEINNKTDGIADHLLPHTHLEFAYRDS